jgi:hypothetical protein
MRDQELWPVLHFDSTVPFAGVDARRQGNSLQELRLSFEGYRFADWIKQYANLPAVEPGSWLRINLGASSKSGPH